MHNIHKERQNNAIQFYIQQLYVQILLLNILSTHYGCLLLIKIPKTQVFGDATLCHWVRVTHPVLPFLDYLTQMTKALWTLGELGNTHQTSITSKKAWIFSNNNDNLKSWIKCLSSLELEISKLSDSNLLKSAIPVLTYADKHSFNSSARFCTQQKHSVLFLSLHQVLALPNIHCCSNQL